MKKNKKSGSEYFNYKGYSLLLLALVEYKFLWVNVGSSGSSDAQIFNRNKLRRKIEKATMGLPSPEPLGSGLLILHYFLLIDETFAPMSWLVKPYSRRQLTREERIVNYRKSRGRRVVENAFGILVGRFRVLLTTMAQRREVVRDIVLRCVVLNNMLKSHQGGADRPPTPADDIQPPQAENLKKNLKGGQTIMRLTERLVLLKAENFKKPSREAKP